MEVPLLCTIIFYRSLIFLMTMSRLFIPLFFRHAALLFSMNSMNTDRLIPNSPMLIFISEKRNGAH